MPRNKYMKQLTDRAKQFCEEYVKNGYNARQAYKTAYWMEDDNTASVAAHRMLQDKRVKDEVDRVEWSFQIIGYKIGVTKERLMQTIKDMLEAKKVVWKTWSWELQEAPDWTSRFNAIKGAALLMGIGKNQESAPEDDSEEKEDDKSIQLMSAKELIEAKKRLLKQL